MKSERLMLIISIVSAVVIIVAISFLFTFLNRLITGVD